MHFPWPSLCSILLPQFGSGFDCSLQHYRPYIRCALFLGYLPSVDSGLIEKSKEAPLVERGGVCSGLVAFKFEVAMTEGTSIRDVLPHKLVGCLTERFFALVLESYLRYVSTLTSKCFDSSHFHDGPRHGRRKESLLKLVIQCTRASEEANRRVRFVEACTELPSESPDDREQGRSCRMQ